MRKAQLSLDEVAACCDWRARRGGGAANAAATALRENSWMRGGGTKGAQANSSLCHSLPDRAR